MLERRARMHPPHRRMDAPWRQTTLRLSPCNGRRTSVVTGTPRKPPNGRIPSALWEQRPFPHPLPSQFDADLPDGTTHLHRMARGPDGPGLWEGPVLPGVAGERVVRVVVDNRAAIENVGAVQPAAGADVLASLGHRLVRSRPLSLDRAQRLAAGVVRRRFADEDVLVLLAVELVLAGAADEDVASATAEDSVVPGATHQDISRRAAGDVVVPGFAIHLHGDVRVARDAHPVV